jgi:hypothetical protein
MPRQALHSIAGPFGELQLVGYQPGSVLLDVQGHHTDVEGRSHYDHACVLLPYRAACDLRDKLIEITELADNWFGLESRQPMLWSGLPPHSRSGWDAG